MKKITLYVYAKAYRDPFVRSITIIWSFSSWASCNSAHSRLRACWLAEPNQSIGRQENDRKAVVTKTETVIIEVWIQKMQSTCRPAKGQKSISCKKTIVWNYKSWYTHLYIKYLATTNQADTWGVCFKKNKTKQFNC